MTMKAAKKPAGVEATKKPSPPPLRLRGTDQETARVVAIHRANGDIVGAGCLVDKDFVLTCRHVVEAAVAPVALQVGDRLPVTLAGVTGQPTVWAEVQAVGPSGPENDMAVLKMDHQLTLDVLPVEFASPLRHGGKSYSVLGFPGGDQQGRNARGSLFAADAKGLVQMDRGGALSVLGGFSGAPVWSAEVNAFVGIVVTELAASGVSWCIPSRLLCRFFPQLMVRFRIPVVDRPVINDYWEDDPNIQLFGTVSDNGQRRLTATIAERKNDYKVHLTYECIGDVPPRGGYVTVITFPDYKTKDEDGYEVFLPLENGQATVTLKPGNLYTVAAIGDAGDTLLTLNLEAQHEAS